MVRLPNVLILTHEIPQTIKAGSMQLYRVLSDYPPERLLVLGPTPQFNATLLDCRYERYDVTGRRWSATRFHRQVNTLNTLGLLPDFQPRRIDALVGNFRPDVVVTVMDCFSYYKHAWLYARHRGVLLMLVSMDDPTAFERVLPWAESQQRRAISRIYGGAALSLGVCREMAEHIQDRYGKQTVTFHFGPPDGMTPRPPERNAALIDPSQLSLGYAGALGYYGTALVDSLPALEAAGAHLHLYGAEPSRVPCGPGVTYHGYLPNGELWARVQAECDAVIHCYPFDDPVPILYRTQFPTKLSEYCWLGMPMVLTGPAEATGIRWGLEHPDAALTVTSPGPAALTAVLQRLKLDRDLRVAISARSAAAARDEFDPQRIRETFTAHLVAAATPQNHAS